MLDLLTAAPKEVKFGDKTIRVGALKLRELGLIQRWIRDHAVRPTVRVQEELRYVPDVEHRQKLKDAYYEERDQWPPAVGSVAGQRVLFDHEDGQRFFLGVMLRKYQPEMTDAEVDEFAGGLDPIDFGTLVRIAFGADDLDPEAARAAARAQVTGTATAPAAPTTEDSSTTSTPGRPT